MYDRIYICHTFYHVYVTCLKELAIWRAAGAVVSGQPDSERKKSLSSTKQKKIKNATLMLSQMSTDFVSLLPRIRQAGLFDRIVAFDEKREDFFEELAPLRENTGSVIHNMWNRIAFCRRFPRLEANYVPLSLRQYKHIYVYCDSDPIGYFLNANRIKYHAVEDGLNCLKRFDAARYDNRGFFPLKVLMARLGLIFIQNGYAKYCVDMEINDKSVLPVYGEEDQAARRMEAVTRFLAGGKPRYVERPRRELTKELTAEEKTLLTRIFIENMEALEEKLQEGAHRPRVLVLTEKICDPKTRIAIFRDIVARYSMLGSEDALVMVKPHPRDEINYALLFENLDVAVLPGDFPMELLNFVDGLVFDKVVSVFTQTDDVLFAKERVSLAEEFDWAAPENYVTPDDRFPDCAKSGKV